MEGLGAGNWSLKPLYILSRYYYGVILPSQIDYQCQFPLYLFMVVLEVKPMVPRLLGKCSTTEWHITCSSPSLLERVGFHSCPDWPWTCEFKWPFFCLHPTFQIAATRGMCILYFLFVCKGSPRALSTLSKYSTIDLCLQQCYIFDNCKHIVISSLKAREYLWRSQDAFCVFQKLEKVMFSKNKLDVDW